MFCLYHLKGLFPHWAHPHGIIGVAVRAADVVDALDGFIGGLENPVEVLHFVHNPVRAALLGSAVVGQDQQDGVVELPQGPQPVHQAADLVVGVVQKRGEGLLEPAGQQLVVLRERVPRLDAVVPGRKLGSLGDHPQLELPLVPPLAHDVPAFVVAAPVFLQVSGWRLMGGVDGAEGQVGEEGAVGAHPHAVVDHEEQLVHQVFAEVIAVFGLGRGFDVVVVRHQLGVELVGLSPRNP